MIKKPLTVVVIMYIVFPPRPSIAHTESSVRIEISESSDPNPVVLKVDQIWVPIFDVYNLENKPIQVKITIEGEDVLDVPDELKIDPIGKNTTIAPFSFDKEG